MEFANTVLIRCTILAVFIVTLYGCATPTTQRGAINNTAVELEAEKQREYAVRQLINDNKRLYAVGFPILQAGLPLCEEKRTWGMNAFIVNKYDFSEEARQTVVNTYDLGNTLKIFSAFPGGPAQEAGLKEGDAILEINGKPIPVGEDASSKLDEMLTEEIGESGDSFSLTISRDGKMETAVIEPVERCDYPIAFDPSNEINAYADGSAIYMTKGMLNFTNNDDELALVLAHELAHNNMDHIDSKRMNAAGGLFLDILIAATTGAVPPSERRCRCRRTPARPCRGV